MAVAVEINLDYKVNTQDVIKQTRALSNEIDNALKSSNGDTNAFGKYTQKIDTAIGRVKELSKTLEEARQKQFDTPIKNTQDAIKVNQGKINTIKNNNAQGSNTGNIKIDNKSIEDYRREIDKLKTDLDNLYTRKNSGEFINVDDAGLKELTTRLSFAKDEVERYYNSYKKSTSVTQSTKSTMSFSRVLASLNKSAGRVTSTISRMLKVLGSGATSGLKKLSSIFYRTSKSSDGFNDSLKHSFKVMLKYAFGIKSLFFLVRKLRSAFKENLGYLMTYDTELNNSVQGMIRNFSIVKGSLATAFAPLVTAAAPAINYILQLITKLLNGIAQLNAAITGKSTFTTVTNATKSYTDATNDASKATKKLQDNLSGLDEVHKWNDDEDTSSSGSGGSGADNGGLSFDTKEIGDAFKELRDLIYSQDWEGLGLYIADKINKGMQKVYDVIDWSNAKKKIVPFIDAFTRTFNSLVDNIDFNLMGRTIGAGINTLAYSFNMLVEKIHFEKIGSQLANAVKGLVDKVDAKAVGEAIGNKLMLIPRILYGFTQKMTSGGVWLDIGKTIGDGINGFFNKFDLSTITTSIANILNGIRDIFNSTTETINWGEISQNIIDGIKNFFDIFDGKGFGQSINNFLTNLVNTICEIVDNTDWEQVGGDIADAIFEIDWVTLFVKVGGAMVKALFQAFMGALKKHPVQVLSITSFFAIKGAAGLALQVLPLIKNMGGLSTIFGKLTKSAPKVAGSIGKLGDASSSAKGGIGGLNSSMGGLSSNFGEMAGKAVQILAVAGAVFILAEAFKILSQTAIDLANAGPLAIVTMGILIALIGGLFAVIALLGPQLDIAGAGALMVGAAILLICVGLNLITPLIEYIVDALPGIIQSITDLVNIIGGIVVQVLALVFSWVYQIIDLLSTRFIEIINTVTNSILLIVGLLGGLFLAILQTVFDFIINLINSIVNGITSIVDSVTNGISTIVDAISTGVSTIVDSVSGLLETIFNGVKDLLDGISNIIKTIGDSISKVIDSIFGGIKGVIDAFTNQMKALKQLVHEFAEEGWSAAKGAIAFAAGLKVVKNQLEDMENMKALTNLIKSMANNSVTASNAFVTMVTSVKLLSNQLLASVGHVIQIQNQINALNSVLVIVSNNLGANANIFVSWRNIVTSAVGGAVNGVCNDITRMVSSINSASASFTAAGQNLGTALSNGIKNGLNEGLVHIETALNRIVGGLNDLKITADNQDVLVHANKIKIPKLAQGAVIPPNKEFLAVLGDQQQGTNIEAPLDTIKQAVAEVIGTQNKGQYEFIAQINRKTLFDEFINEAKLRQQAYGVNPLTQI